MAEEIPKQTTPEQETTAPTGKKKKEKGKSFLETMREIDAKEQQQEEADQQNNYQHITLPPAFRRQRPRFFRFQREYK